MKCLVTILLILVISFEPLMAIEIYGNHIFTNKDILRVAEQNKNYDSLLNQIQTMYQNQGYFNAAVHIDSSSAKGDRNIIIQEGRASKIESLEVNLVPKNATIDFNDLIFEFRGQIASQSNLNSLAERCIARLAEQGMPFASAQWSSFIFSVNGDIKGSLQILAGPLVRISEISYRGLNRTRPGTLNRVLCIHPGDNYDETKIIRSERFIDQMPYLRVAAPFDVEPVGNGDSCRIIFNTKELPSTRFDGAGSVSSIKGKSAFVGRLDLEFGDILGTGRAFGLHWNKKDRFSSELRVNYLEPYLLKSQFDLNLEAHQVDRDTLFIESGGTIELSHRFGNGLGGSLSLGIGRTVPETGSRVPSSNSRTIGLKFNYNNIERPTNPTAGYSMNTIVSYKYRSNQSADSNSLPTKMTSAGIDLRYFAPISHRFIAAIGLTTWGIVSNDGQAPPDELHYLGGFESLRGYAERQIPGYRYAIATIEPRLITGRESRTYLFCDLAEIKDGQVGRYRFFPGYGLGLAAPTALGQFKLEIGWGKNGFPSNAIINFGLAGGF